MKVVPMALGVALLSMPALALAADPAASINVRLRVAEWANVAREAEPVTGGVPLPAGLTKNVHGLCLTDEKDRPVPAQFAPLVRDRDGYLRWILVDSQTDLDSGAAKTFTLKAGTNPEPDVRLQVQSRGRRLEITTGPMRVAVSRRFNFLDSVWIDSNGDGAFSRGERLVVPSKRPNIVVEDADTGLTYTSLAGRARTPRFEYLGPLRATVVIDGDLADAAGRVGLGYRTRITAFAGKTLLLVEHSLRNSREKAAVTAKIKRSELALGLTDDLTQYHLGLEKGRTADGALAEGDRAVASQSGPARYEMTLLGKEGPKELALGKEAPGWLFASSAARGVLLFDRDFVPDAPSRMVYESGRLSFEDVPAGSAPFRLADMTTEVCRLALDFAARSAAKIEPAPLMARVRSPLVLLADPAYVARLGALGGPFATVEEEIKVYRDLWKLGWKDSWRGPAPPEPAAYRNWPADLHLAMPADELRDVTLEMVRTGDAGFYHQAAALARSRAHEAVPRSDGFETPALNAERMQKRQGWRSAPLSWGGSLADWYCLTGDAEALGAAVDAAEAVSAAVPDDKNKRGTGLVSPGHLSALCHVYDATHEPKWQPAIGRMLDLIARSPLKDERGFLALDDQRQRARAEGEARGETVTSGLHVAELSRALQHAQRITGNEDARDFIIALGRLAQKHLIDPSDPRMPEVLFFDDPKPGSGPYDVPPLRTARHPHHAILCVDILARAYLLTGDRSFLKTARTAWSRGTEKPKHSDKEGLTGRLLQDENLFSCGTNDAWARVFFWVLSHPRTDTQPPKAVTDLATRPGPNKKAVYLTWTAPEDQGGGTVAVYQVKRSDLPIVEYKAFNYAKDKGKKRPWWFTTNLADEPAPGKPGSKERFLVRDLKAGTHYFALRARDDAGNESPLSNVVKVEMKRR